MNKDIMLAKPPLRETGSEWNAWGFSKSLSTSTPLKILLENLLTIKKMKKVRSEKIDKKPNSIDSDCIYFFKPLLFFLTI